VGKSEKQARAIQMLIAGMVGDTVALEFLDEPKKENRWDSMGYYGYELDKD